MSEIEPREDNIREKPMNWAVEPHEISEMSETELRMVVIELNEKVRRLYEATKQMGTNPRLSRHREILDPNHNDFDENETLFW